MISRLRRVSKSMMAAVFGLSVMTLACTGAGMIQANAAYGPGMTNVETGQTGDAGPIDNSRSIRIMIMNTGYQSIFHQGVTLWASVPVTMTYGGNETVVGAGEEITISLEDERLNGGSIVFRPQTGSDEISVRSISRALGVPGYSGTLEVKKEAEGLTLINQVSMGNYLAKVLPSEMPTYYEMEALKAQVVCARTYALNRIQNKVYAKYNAHVDDSISFQVYNNVKSNERAMQAVRETDGKLLTYQGTPVEGYFFSTSCGYTTDSTIWKDAHKSITGYLKGIPMMEGAQALDLTNNDSFSAFIKDKNYPAYDSSEPFYRWETILTSTQLEQKIGDIGAVKNLSITERGAGGIAKSLTVEGTEGSKVINGQNEIRAILGNASLAIVRNNKSTVTGWVTLPSAYIAIEAGTPDDSGVTAFQIYGGGYGHGVGMSQNGAQGMAKSGKNFEEILKFFFNDVEVKTIS